MSESGTKSSTNPKDLAGRAKPMLSLVPGAALVHLSEALRNGMNRYGRANWRKTKVEAMTYVDATLRHLEAWTDGENVASDSGVHHLAHAGACVVILIDALEQGTLIDNRPEPGVFGRVAAESAERRL